LKGSWAGALGQPQFMPSSYLKYAQDFDGDGRRDIWTSHADVFASIAYYLQQHGWHTGVTWGREVEVDASLIRDGRRAFLVYDNYEALLDYNCAHTYALSVALLSDRL
jgi:membrane-bound lytic murein transglycosylase B